jgi:predicted  nucleic acid-binding Zn-ribbon protein
MPNTGDNEIARIREKLDSVEGKHKEDVAKAQDKFDAEHNRRLEQERQIEDNWSRKVQKRNGTISDLEAKNKVLEQKVDAFSQPAISATPKEETGKNSAQISKVHKQNVTLKKLLEDGSKKYKALKEEKQSLEEEVREQFGGGRQPEKGKSQNPRTKNPSCSIAQKLFGQYKRKCSNSSWDIRLSKVPERSMLTPVSWD